MGAEKNQLDGDGVPAVASTASRTVVLVDAKARPPKPWDRKHWRPLDIGAPRHLYVGRLDAAELIVKPAISNRGWMGEVVLDGVRYDVPLGHKRSLARTRADVWRMGGRLLARRWLRPGVPGPDELDRYGYNQWMGRPPELAAELLGRFVRSPNGTLRFETDRRPFYEHRDELRAWGFAPVDTAGKTIDKWWEPTEAQAVDLCA